MRRFDRFVQRWRLQKARPWVPQGARILDIGCHQGEFLESLGEQIVNSIGLDPLAPPVERERYSLCNFEFNEPLPFEPESFDVISMLAVLEHIVDKEPISRECRRLLKPEGRVIITVPGPAVDWIMNILVTLRIAEGMSLEEHHGYNPRLTPAIFQATGFTTEHWSRFQLGCNHLFVFRKSSVANDLGRT